MTLRSRSSDPAGLARIILAAIAAGSTGVATVGCPSEVIDGGGGRATGVSVGPWDPTTTNPGGAGEGAGIGDGGGHGGENVAAWCEPQKQREFGTFHYVCASAIPTPCPGPTDPVVADALGPFVNEPGGCGNQLENVSCGPDPSSADTCCYVVEVGESICEGRPFRVADRAIVAGARPREDWAATVSVESSSLSAVERAALARAWTTSALAEHASVASFARAVLELMALGAPAELLGEAQLAMGDEITHAQLCFGIASSLGGARTGAGPLSIAGALSGDIDPKAVAIATVVEGCINETICAHLAQAERDAATDPAVLRALDRIAADEARHAALAWRTVVWLVETHGDEVRSAVAEAFASARPFAPAPSAIDDLDPDLARAFGRLPISDARTAARRAFDEIVRPCAEQLLATCKSRSRAPEMSAGRSPLA